MFIIKHGVLLNLKSRFHCLPTSEHSCSQVVNILCRKAEKCSFLLLSFSIHENIYQLFEILVFANIFWVCPEYSGILAHFTYVESNLFCMSQAELFSFILSHLWGTKNWKNAQATYITGCLLLLQKRVYFNILFSNAGLKREMVSHLISGNSVCTSGVWNSVLQLTQ